MKQRSRAGILYRIAHAIGRQDEDRGGRKHPVIDDVEHARRRENGLVIGRIAFNLALLSVLAGIVPTGDRVKLLEHLLIVCSDVSCVIAIATRERWSLSAVNRWDEALIFTTIAMGLRSFAPH